MVSLRDLAKQFDFSIHLTPARTVQLEKTVPVAVSSTLVRHLVATCQFQKVRQCLGREYLLSGKIVSGRGLGRTIGFPTANLQLYSEDQLVPEDGVFAGWARWADDHDQAWSKPPMARAAISVGRCETFSNGTWQGEAFLLDLNKNNPPSLLGSHMLLSFEKKIRPQQRFDSPEQLSLEIENDCRKVRQILTHTP